MQLLQISDRVIINTDRIEVIEFTDSESGMGMLITVAGTTYTVDRPMSDIFNFLGKSGVDLTKQYFGG
jgi:hypothetical protein